MCCFTANIIANIAHSLYTALLGVLSDESLYTALLGVLSDESSALLLMRASGVPCVGAKKGRLQ